MNTLPLRNIIHVGRLTILLPVGIMLILSAYLSSINAQDELDDTLNHADSYDMLAYVTNEGQLMLYDLHERTEITLLENVDTFLMGRDDRIAFTTLNEGDTDLYVIDPAIPDPIAVNISQSIDTGVYPLAWSPDGHYLAFVSYIISEGYSYMWTFQGSYRASSRDQSLYVWDGENVTNIMPDNGLATASGFYVDWSPDGRLAFTIEYGSSAEIYLWDGNTTTNLSQNPDGWDSGGLWSRSGQLMFVSSRDEKRNVYIWDGVSYKNRLPDIDSFVILAPELRPTMPIWTDEDGIIAFTVYTDDSLTGEKEIVWWGIEVQTVIRRVPVASDNVYSSLAKGGQFILSYHMASGLPSEYVDVETVEGDILFGDRIGNFSWNPSGYLAFCAIDDDRNWILSIWNGEETWEVARNHPKPVQWRSEQYIFSCNNG